MKGIAILFVAVIQLIAFESSGQCTPPVPTIVNYPNPNCTGVSSWYYTESGKENYVWTWPPGGTLVGGGGSNDHYLVINWSTLGPKTITLTYADNGCSAAAPTSATFDVVNQPVPTLTGDEVVCFPGGYTHMYTTEPGMISYTYWASPGAIITVHTQNGDIFNIQNGSSTGNGTTSNSANRVSIQWPSSGAKYLAVSWLPQDGCPSVITTKNITVNALPTPTISGPSTACPNVGGQMYFTETGKSAYSWYAVNGSITSGQGTNTVAVTWGYGSGQRLQVYYEENGCSPSAVGDRVVAMNPVPTPSLTGNTTTCQGSTHTYSAPSGKYNYTWPTPVGGVVTAGGNSTSNSITINWTAAGSRFIYVSYSDTPGGCMSEPAGLLVNTYTVPILSLSPTPSGGCIANPVTVNYSVTGGTSNFAWTVLGGTINSGQGTNTVNVTWTGIGAKSLGVTASGFGGCPAQPLSYNFSLYQRPTPTITGPANMCLNQTANFLTESNMTNYMWRVDATTFPPNPSAVWPAQFTSSGQHLVAVAYFDPNGCFSFTGNKNITVDSYPINTVQTLSTLNNINKTYGNPPFNPGVTSSHGLSVTYTSSNPVVATVSGSTITIVGAGTSTITATQAGTTCILGTSSPSRTLTVAKAPQTITFDPLPNVAFGSAPPALPLNASSGLPISYTSSNTAVATISGNTITIVGAGSTTITASQAGNPNYLAATQVSRSLTVTAGSQSITFGPLATRTYGDAPFGLTASASSGLTVSFTSLNTAVAQITGTTLTIAGAGSATIRASQSGNSNYSSAPPVDQILVVNKANQVISSIPIPSKNFGDLPFQLTWTSSSGLPVSYSSSNSSVIAVSGTSATIVGVGTTLITATQAGNSNYNPAASVSQSVTVNKGNQTISFGALPQKVYGNVPFTLTATASSSLAVSYTSSNPAVATILGSTLTIVGAGVSTITASQSGNASWNAASSVQQQLTVTKANQVITFLTVPVVCGQSVGLTGYATTTSGLPITFNSSNPSIASISGTSLAFHEIGTVTITASQAGNANVNAATPSIRTIYGDPNPQGVIYRYGTLCEGTVTLEAGPGTLFTWHDGGYSSQSRPVYYSGVYTVTYTLGSGCEVTTQMDVPQCDRGDGGPYPRKAITQSDPEPATPFDQDYQLGVYPNPAQETVRIVLSETAKQDCPVMFHDILGRLSKRTEITKGRKSEIISIAELQPGIYVVSILDNGEPKQMKLIIKRE